LGTIVSLTSPIIVAPFLTFFLANLENVVKNLQTYNSILNHKVFTIKFTDSFTGMSKIFFEIFEQRV